MASLALSFFLMLIPLFLTSSSEARVSIGINYRRVANDLPSPSKVVELLKTEGLNRMKLYETDANVVTALANTGIKVGVAMPNELLSSAAANQSFTDEWVKANIAAYHPASQIEAIAVGNEVFATNYTNDLVPAMKNVYASLTKLNLEKDIKIFSPITLSALQTYSPTSSGSFKPDLVEPVIIPMFEFLRQTGSYLFINPYHFLSDDPFFLDPVNGFRYMNLRDAQIDAVFAAMSALKYDDVKVAVTETVWSSKGDSNENGAGEDKAASYNGNLVKRVFTRRGTPLRPNHPLNVFRFALFNGEKGTTASFRGESWCVAIGNVGKEKLEGALEYACGVGGADCTPIQHGGTCYDPNTLEAHASYAFNSYYQKNSRASGSCDFGGAAYVVTQPPKYGKCEFPRGY